MQFIADNQLVVGIVVTGILAALLTCTRNLPARFLSWIWSLFTVSLEIKNSDLAFNWFSMWLDCHPYSKTARRLLLHTHYEIQASCQVSDISKAKPHVLFTPAKGHHVLWHHGRLLWISRITDVTGQPGSYMNERESFKITVLGRNQNIIRTIVDEALMCSTAHKTNETLVITSSEGNWLCSLQRHKRPVESVILTDGVMKYLLDDMRTFLASHAWYDSIGIPYRRGYLLHGVAGSGKTSAILAAAGALNLNVYMLNLGDKSLDDGQLNSLLTQVPVGGVVVLEDVDVIFPSRENQDKASRSHVTLSGLLNALDGIAAREGRFLFMTTNYIERLDKALIRPGRTDIHIEFGPATVSQACQLFQRFFPDVDNHFANVFASRIIGRNKSMADLQAHLLCHRDNPRLAASSV